MEKTSQSIARGTNRTRPVCESWEYHIDVEACYGIESACVLDVGRVVLCLGTSFCTFLSTLAVGSLGKGS
jgi:hypothetical protein